jgi:hypothetical protein
MKFSRIAMSFLAVAGLAMIAQPAIAQLPGILPGNASSSERAQAQAQQRIQAQAQQRAQARVQQQLQAQTQTRLQVDAARAANIAQRTAAIAQQQAHAAKQRAAAGAAIRIGVDAGVRSRNQAAGQSVNANLAAQLGIDSRLAIPADMTEDDVKIYDNFFGRFNPLREQAHQETAAAANSKIATTANSGTAESTAEQDAPQQTADGANSKQRGTLDLASRIEIAAAQRRAEISEMRDQALATSNTQLLLQAERMEEAMNALVEAQSRVRAEGDANIENRSSTARQARLSESRKSVRAKAENEVDGRRSAGQGRFESENKAGANSNSSLNR